MAEEKQLTTNNRTANPVIDQFINKYKEIPLSGKILMGVAVLLVLTGFAILFLWANKTDFQPVYTGLSPEDASQIVQKLEDQNIPHKLAGGGSVIMVPAEKVYDVRLSLAGSGLPKGGGVGFEIFDETDFGTTEFVQKLNYQRALQGELARTIKEFAEVESARVMIVMPKDSVFIEEVKPPSASVLLKLRTQLSQEKVSAVVHLVASSIEGLEPSMITIVDTNGNVLSKGVSEDKDENIGNKQLEYKFSFEQSLAKRIQSMLESIVGKGKAIVRVTADMDFSQIDINEEIFDPDAQVIRSRHNIVESSDNKSGIGEVSSVNPLTPAGAGGKETTEQNQKQNETVNYEINKTLRRTIKPVGSVNRLSVAAVLDGTYTFETDEDGKQVRTYNQRTQAELDQFATIVRQAMGYNVDREDQISVESFPFVYMEEISEPVKFDFFKAIKEYRMYIINILMIILIITFVVMPIVKTMRTINETIAETAAVVAEEEARALAPPEEKDLLPDIAKMSVREKAVHLAREDIDKTTNIMRLWLKEAD